MLTARALDPETWPAFETLAEKNNGVWGGCWWVVFHAEYSRKDPPPSNRDLKHDLVQRGRAHAALVFDGEEAVGWCQFGNVDELPKVRHQKAYDETVTCLPDWRITCFFVDKKNRKRGVAVAALAGALNQIAKLGGGVVESIPEAAAHRKVSSSFLYNSTVGLFEQQGFERVRQLGKHHWLMRKTVAPA